MYLEISIESNIPIGGDIVITKKKVIQSLMLMLINYLPFRSNKTKLTIWSILFLILEIFNSFSNTSEIL
jgi:hypothetical protein